MTIRKEIDLNKPLTTEQKQMLEALQTKPVQPDEDCPELTAEQLSQLVRVSELRRDERRKQTVTLRLSPQALKKAKSLGKGYTSVLSRILENALNDNEVIKRNL
ncbi:MAG: BrnA antitoxin family protein [Oscillospiraceae bacterium]|nr:BrnA antitoxin family protein [Oscillospiraceae bacterium]